MSEKIASNGAPYLGGLAVENCFRCSNPLTMKEMKAQHVYCSPCAKVIADNAHREELGRQIHSANGRMK